MHIAFCCFGNSVIEKLSKTHEPEPESLLLQFGFGFMHRIMTWHQIPRVGSGENFPYWLCNSKNNFYESKF